LWWRGTLCISSHYSFLFLVVIIIIILWNMLEQDKYASLEYSIMSSDTKSDKGNNLRGFGREKQAEACTWSLVNKEAETLINLNENALSSHSAYSKGNKSHKGILSFEVVLYLHLSWDWWSAFLFKNYRWIQPFYICLCWETDRRPRWIGNEPN